jgi:hypothetical protein
MSVQCVITGVLLIHPDGDVAYNGDLFEYDKLYVCNCNEQSAHTPPEDLGGIRWVKPPRDYWERKGVWVFEIDQSKHSIAALEYMNK